MSAAGSTKRPLNEEAYGRWGMIVSPVLTPDGKRVLHLRADCHGRRNLHVRDLETGGEAVMEDVREAYLPNDQIRQNEPARKPATRSPRPDCPNFFARSTMRKIAVR